MTPNAEAITEQAMLLPEEDRIGIAERLLASVSPMSPAIEAAWDDEIRARMAEYKAGNMTVHAWDEVLAETLQRHA